MDFQENFLHRRPKEHTIEEMGYGCSITFDLLINRSYSHENKNIRASVYQAPEKKIKLPHW